jgi:Protein of unknown function (DUF3309)
MSLGGILVLILVLILIGVIPGGFPHAANWGYYPSGGVGLVLVIVVILVLLGRL